MSEESSASAEPAPEPPPLWGEAVFTRGDGAVIAAQIKVSGEGMRIEAACLIETGETLTGPDGQVWRVAATKVSADGGYSWASLSLADLAVAAQQPLNQIAPEPEQAPAPARRRKADATDADAASEPANEREPSAE